MTEDSVRVIVVDDVPAAAQKRALLRKLPPPRHALPALQV